ncbi:hypothetical protein [Nocardioides sp. SYSU DS0651]|uniref:hypothetical protein n=1 Tax=Nocardioides sp. SYSU DS0651 TaxID=3415955 RepID=UPI003F4C66E8
MRTVLRGLLSSALIAAFLAAVPAGAVVAAPALPADACAELDLADRAAVVERADKVDDVFVGRVVDVARRRIPSGSPNGTDGESATASTRSRERVVVHRVTVTTSLSGDLRLGERVSVVFEQSEDGRDRLLAPRETHLFFTSDVDGQVRADYCEGSQELSGGLSAAMQRRLEGYLDGPPEPPARVALHRPAGGVDEPPRLGRVVAPGAAISLVGVLGLFLVARVGRRRG